MSDPILVVGGDGLIGRALCLEFAERGEGFVATSRRGGGREGGAHRLDLARPEEWELPESCRAAVLCAAATRLDFCRDHPGEARRINVENTLKLSRALSDRGALVVFLSTNLVFNGDTPHTPADAPQDPRTVYGEMKAEVEQRLSEHAERSAIVRLSKVFSPEMPLLTDWRNALATGGRIDAFTDYRCAPIDLATTVRAIADVAVGEREGVWQLSPAEDVSYAEVAAEVARRLGADPGQVHAIPSSDKTTLEHVPEHTTLDASRARRELGLEFPDMPAVLDRVLES